LRRVRHPTGLFSVALRLSHESINLFFRNFHWL
jgi:hypothetical protein